MLGVLRRPASASQQVSARALRRLPGGGLEQVTRGLYPRYVRHVQRNGIAYYFIPAANANQVRHRVGVRALLPNREQHLPVPITVPDSARNVGS